MSSRTAHDPEFEEPISKPRPRGLFRLIQLIAILGAFGLFLMLMMPFTRNASGAARRAQCTNDLKQIGLALHNYESSFGVFPPAYTVDSAGRPLHSWRTLLLPYMEQEPLY